MRVNEVGLDLFKEIGNIGSGNAATALSTMLNTKIDLKVPHCGMVELSKASDILGGPDSVVASVLMQMSGDLDGFIMLVQKVQDAKILIETLLGSSVDIPDECGEDCDMEKIKEALSPLPEVGNILVGSYLSAIADMAQMEIVPSVPMFTIDMARAVMNVTAVAYGDSGEEILQINTEFICETGHFSGHYFLIPTEESYDKFVKALTAQ